MCEPSKQIKQIQALPRADGAGVDVTYEKGSSRRVHQFKFTDNLSEPMPHGAGSYHDPEQHRILMDRIDAMHARKG